MIEVFEGYNRIANWSPLCYRRLLVIPLKRKPNVLCLISSNMYRGINKKFGLVRKLKSIKFCFGYMKETDVIIRTTRKFYLDPEKIINIKNAEHIRKQLKELENL